MAREDQMEALYEFFGGTPNTYHTSPSAFQGIATVVKGEPLDVFEWAMPLLWISAPRSKEYRQAAQKKFIDYTLMAVLVQLAPGGSTAGDEGPVALNNFYQLLDEIANKIRTNKTLITPSYPNGASIRFGEDFTIEENHQRLENEILLVATIEILSTELVQA